MYTIKEECYGDEKPRKNVLVVVFTEGNRYNARIVCQNGSNIGDRTILVDIAPNYEITTRGGIIADMVARAVKSEHRPAQVEGLCWPYNDYQTDHPEVLALAELRERGIITGNNV